MKFLKKFIHTKLTIITIVMLPLAVFALLTSRMEVFGIRSFVVLTGSMNPTIPQGSIVFTKHEEFYSTRDIIAFNTDDKVITHRIVDTVNKNNVLSYTTKGDANNTTDNTLVAKKDVVGKTLFHVPMAGTFILYLRTLPGFISFIILPGLLFIGFELWTIKNHIEKETEKKFMKQITDLRQ